MRSEASAGQLKMWGSEREGCLGHRKFVERRGSSRVRRRFAGRLTLSRKDLLEGIRILEHPYSYDFFLRHSEISGTTRANGVNSKIFSRPNDNDVNNRVLSSNIFMAYKDTKICFGSRTHVE